MYFSGNKETIAKINQVPYQVKEYDDKSMLQAKLMDNTQVEIFTDNGTTRKPNHTPMTEETTTRRCQHRDFEMQVATQQTRQGVLQPG